MTEFTPLASLLGGALIGLSAVLLMAWNGQVAGISGILDGATAPEQGGAWRYCFLGGLLAGPLAWRGRACPTARPVRDAPARAQPSERKARIPDSSISPARSFPSRDRSPTPQKMECPPCSTAKFRINSTITTVFPTPAPPKSPILPPFA